MTITSIPGVQVGHWTDPVAKTGCTVVLVPEPNVAAVEIRGAAPGSRETALLAPGMRVETIQAILLSGGSAFGLAAADGVMAELEQAGRGHPTPAGPVPIVPTAVIFDLLVGDPSVRPGPEQGAAAVRAASADPVEMGSIGAGSGAMVAGWRGFEAITAGGLGSACAPAGDAQVGALVVASYTFETLRLLSPRIRHLDEISLFAHQKAGVTLDGAVHAGPILLLLGLALGTLVAAAWVLERKDLAN